MLTLFQYSDKGARLVGGGGDDCVLGVDTYILVVSGKLDEHCCSLKKG